MAVNNYSYSKGGLALTELFEGDVLTAYQDQKGVWTIGYGHTAGVQPGQTITQAQAEAYLLSDVTAAVKFVNEVVEVALTQAQFDALVDVSRVLDELGARGYAERVARRPGQKEDRFRQLLGGSEAADEPVTGPVAAGGFDEPVAAARDDGALEARVAALEAEVARLRAELAGLLD